MICCAVAPLPMQTLRSCIYKRNLHAHPTCSTQEAISRLMESEIKKKMLAHVMQEFEVRFVDRATVADADLPQRPNKPLMAGAGLAFGLLVGIATSLLLYRRELAKKGSPLRSFVTGALLRT